MFEPQPGTYSLKEQIPDGYGEPFLWQCTGLSIEGLAPPISTINFFRIVIDSGQVIECDWMNVPEAIDDLQANPTERPTEEPIDDITGEGGEGTVQVRVSAPGQLHQPIGVRSPLAPRLRRVARSQGPAHASRSFAGLHRCNRMAGHIPEVPMLTNRPATAQHSTGDASSGRAGQ